MTQMLHSYNHIARPAASFRLGLSPIVPCGEGKKWFDENGTRSVEVRRKQI